MKITLDWNEYINVARQTIAEGCVLLENKNQVLPLKENSSVAIFGRIQNHYYKSGTGSGGMVNVSKVYNIVEGLENSGKVKINQNLQKIYQQWEIEHPYDEGIGWGAERWSQDEMPLSEEIVSNAALESENAIVIIGRTAGEDKDNTISQGSFLLTETEIDMLEKVRKNFKKMIVLLNVGNIIDMSFVKKISPDAVMYVWQGGMIGGLGTADVLTGKINPSGKLSDTIAYNISDYPSSKYFGNPNENNYSEDIFVGYRYFETFAKDKVLYPFGYGLSYSKFCINSQNVKIDEKNQKINLQVQVQNQSEIPGKEIVQIYVKSPCGLLGKPEKVLVDFEKTKLLSQNENQILEFSIPFENFASYDDSGITSHKSAFVLEKGEYFIFVGNDVRSAKQIFSFKIEDLIVIKQCEQALAPISSFERIHFTQNNEIIMEKVPLQQENPENRRKNSLPKEIIQTSQKNIKLSDVYYKKAELKDFIAQFSDEDLSCIIRGEGMGSSLVSPGTASALGGVSPNLREVFGIPAVCCDDGPSGMRLDCGAKAFSLPIGTMLACTFNKDLVKNLYKFVGYEMAANHVDCLLAPGMNIHRNPLNGRNFEYFSEDSFLTGKMGAAVIQGLQSANVTGTIKHFCANNQETNRYAQNSIVSERALREIYLKGFEIAIKAGADSVMTTYGLVNNLYTAGSYDLNTTILRKEWNFEGIVMTDWWAAICKKENSASKTDFSCMIKAQNDLYMCCPDGSRNASGDNTLDSLKNGDLTRAELQRSAINICRFVLKTNAMKRLLKIDDEITIVSRPKNEDDVNLENLKFKILEKTSEFDLTYQECKANTNYVFPFDVQNKGTYKVSLVGNSSLGELAQIPCTFFITGIPISTFTFNGTNGKDVSITREIKFKERFCVCRIFVATNGLNLKNIKLTYLNDDIS